MYYIIDDRLFWIYLIIILVFVVIGISAIVGNTDSLISVIIILWIIVNVILLFLVYLAMTYAVHFSGINCFLLNCVFVFILIFSTLWASEFTYATGDTLRSMAGVLTILGALLFLVLIIPNKDINAIWLNIAYVFIWMGLTIYVTIQ